MTAFWDGNITIIKDVMLMDYYFCLQFAKQNEQSRYRHYGKLQNKNIYYYYGYDYIEKLIDKPLDDFRDYCIWRVFVPYFINVKGLSRLDTFDKVSSWLTRCNQLSRLKFNPRDKLKYELEHVAGYYPISRVDLQKEKPELYVLLQREGIITK